MKRINPFSAEHPVPPNKFAGRAAQVREFEAFLSDTIGDNPKNIAVLGDWGIGKTSLLWYFKQIAEKNGCVGTIIELDRSTASLTSLLETITCNLARDARSKKNLSAKAMEFLESISVTARYGPVGISVSKKSDNRPNTIKFEDDLTRIYNQINCPFIIMLDNIEETFNSEGTLYSLRNMFQMLQSIRGKVRCMLIISGRDSLFREIRSISEPVARFFWAIRLHPFTQDETEEAVQKALGATDIQFDKDVIKKIYEKSRGHPYFVQAISYVLYKNAESNRVTAGDFDRNYGEVLNFLGFRLFESIIESATITERRVLMGFLKSDRDVLTNSELKIFTGIANVTVYLNRLSEQPPSIIRKEERGRYRLFHPLFKEYLRIYAGTRNGNEEEEKR